MLSGNNSMLQCIFFTCEIASYKQERPQTASFTASAVGLMRMPTVLLVSCTKLRCLAQCVYFLSQFLVFVFSDLSFNCYDQILMRYIYHSVNEPISISGGVHRLWWRNKKEQRKRQAGEKGPVLDQVVLVYQW